MRNVKATVFFLCGCALAWSGLAAATPIDAMPAYAGNDYAAAVKPVRLKGDSGVWTLPMAQKADFFPLKPSLSGDFTVAVWLMPSADNAKPDKATALWELRNPGENTRMVLQFAKGRPLAEVVSSGGGLITAVATVALDKWHYFVVTRQGMIVSLYIDGALYARGPLTVAGEFSSFELGRAGPRQPMAGFAVAPRIYGEAVSPAQIAEFARAGNYFAAPSVADTRKSNFGRYPALRVADGEDHPLIDHLHVGATVVPWTAADSKDLLVRGRFTRFHGTRTALFKQIDTDAHGLPVYDEGTSLEDLPGARFARAPRADGLFDLYALGEGTVYGAKNLVRFPNTGTAGAPTFGEPELLLIDGKPYDNAFKSKPIAWTIGDVDGDGVEDIVVAVYGDGGPYWFDKGGAIWAGHDRKEAGRGRGYDATGRWLGNETITELFWAKGARDKDGALGFGPPQQIYDRLDDYPWRWKSWSGDRALGLYRDDAGLWILQAGRQNHLIASKVDFREGKLVSSETVPLLADGESQVDNAYFIVTISQADMDGDGLQEIILDGNPGRIAVLKGDRVGNFKEMGPLQMRGGPLAADTLTVPVRATWSKDGVADLITGDSSGRLLLWEGTDDPLTYHAAKPFTVNGEPVRHLSGENNGSVQGPLEAPWGYLQPTVGVWGDDGEAVIIANDVRSDLVLYRRAGGPTELSAPEMFTHKGKRLPISWRSRPDILPKALNYGGTGQANLLYVDWDGDLAVAIPESPGSTKIARTEKLRYEDGAVIRMSLDGGLWGRTKLSVVDWTGDGRWDVVIGGHAANNRVLYEEPYKTHPDAISAVLENVGTAENPVFKRPQPLRANGELIDVGSHVSSVWATDLTGDGKADLLVGSEDGKVYYFMREDLSW